MLMAQSGHLTVTRQCPLLGVPGNVIENTGYSRRFAARPTVGPASWPERPVAAPFPGTGFSAWASPASGSALTVAPYREPDRFQGTNLTRYNALS
jgi:hypothetical protein